MFWKKRRVPAAQIAMDYASSVNQVAEMLLKHIDSLSNKDASSPVTHRRKEVCAMVWLSAVAAFKSSELERKDKDKLVPLVMQHLLPQWLKYFTSPSEMINLLSGRTADYLSGGGPSNPLTTARGLLHELFSSIGASDHVSIGLGTILTPFIAKSLMADVRFLNNVKSQFGIS
jgi:hypothetical protein